MFIKLIKVLIIICCIILVAGCTTKKRSEFDKGYDLGSSDIARRQYWSQVNLQKQQSNLQSNEASYRTVSVPVQGTDEDGSKYADHNIDVRILDRR